MELRLGWFKAEHVSLQHEVSSKQTIVILLIQHVLRDVLGVEKEQEGQSG